MSGQYFVSWFPIPLNYPLPAVFRLRDGIPELSSFALMEMFVFNSREMVTIGFCPDRYLNEVALPHSGRIGQNVKLNGCDGPAHWLLFHRDSGGCIYAMRAKPCVGKLVGERHGEAGRMGGGDQFVGVDILSFPIVDPKVLVLREGTAPRGDHAFSAPETGDPSGRSVWFHVDRSQDENGPDANKGTTSMPNSHQPLIHVASTPSKLLMPYSSGRAVALPPGLR